MNKMQQANKAIEKYEQIQKMANRTQRQVVMELIDGMVEHADELEARGERHMYGPAIIRLLMLLEQLEKAPAKAIEEMMADYNGRKPRPWCLTEFIEDYIDELKENDN